MTSSEMLHRLERIVLPHLTSSQSLEQLMLVSKLQEIEVMRALQWLSNKKFVTITEQREEILILDKNGLRYKEDGLPERRTLMLLKEKDLQVDELIKKGIRKEEINIVIGTLRGQAAITITKDHKGLLISLTDQGKRLLKKTSLEEQFLQSSFPKDPNTLTAQEQFAYDQLKKRKNILLLEKKKHITATPTAEGLALIKKGIAQSGGLDQLTPELLKTKGWKKKDFRAYDVSINVPRANRGRQHFVNEAIDYAKRIWLDMGFVEMTGDHVQTALWDLDSLFVPQDHPAREMQDTFYIEDPASGKIVDQKLFARIKAVHEHGGTTGSKGWQTPFDKSLSLLNMLRTHTTVLSARKLATLKKKDLPAKFFTIGKVYRNEALDWKHLFEFHQIDGIVIDPKANLRNLKGYLEAFYAKMGFTKVRMRPAHFPYTEVSIEPEIWHPVRKEWVEMGGAGIFRPEVTKTLLGEEIPVLAWGLGLERIISPYYGINDLRELYQNDLEQLRTIKNFIK